MTNYWSTIFVLITTIVVPSMQLTGFECAHKDSSFTVYATNDIAECNKRSSPYNSSTVNVQIIQETRYQEIDYIGCYLQLEYDITYCGSSSHSSVIDHGYLDISMDRHQCHQMIYHDVYPSFGKLTLKPARLNSHEKTIGFARGSVNQENGYCIGETFEWNNMIRQEAILSIKAEYGIFKGKGTWDTSTDNILVDHQGECKRDSPRCRSQSQGNLFFEANFTKSCGDYDVGQVYNGPASFVNHTNGQKYIIVMQKDRSFALSLKDEAFLCNQRVWYTGNEGLFVLMSSANQPQTITSLSKRIPKAVDMELEVLSKLLLIDQERTKDLNHQIAEIEYQFCLERKETLKNMLALAYLDPDEFAYAFVGGPGYQAIRKGELLYLIKCTPVEVKAWNNITSCFDEMPVNSSGKLMFLKPKSRILIDKGTQIECDSMMPSGYRFLNQWYSINRMRIASPVVLDPNVKLNVSFNSVLNFDPSGLYTEDDIQKLRDKILFDEKQDVVNNIVARQVMGMDIDYQGYKLFGNLAYHDVESIGTSMFGIMFYYINKIGIFISFLIGIIVIFRSAKAIYLIITNFAVLSTHDADLTVKERLLMSLSNRNTLLHLIQNPTSRTHI